MDEVSTFLCFGWILEVHPVLVSGPNKNTNIEWILFTWLIKSNKPDSLDRQPVNAVD